MNHSRSLNKTNKLHERALKLIYCDHTSTFQELFNKDDWVTLHQKNIQALITLTYEVKNNIAPVMCQSFFT